MAKESKDNCVVINQGGFEMTFQIPTPKLDVATLFEEEAKKLLEKEDSTDKGSLNDIILPIIRSIK